MGDTTAVKLSTREIQVWDMLQAGHRIIEIAGALDLSHSTVHTHIMRIRHKMGISMGGQRGLLIANNDNYKHKTQGVLEAIKQFLEKPTVVPMSDSWLSERQDLITTIEELL